MQINSSILIDNSPDGYYMKDVLMECFSHGEFTTAMIATGYWDLPGMALLYDAIETFLRREHTRLLLLIGEDPLVRTYQQIQPEKKDPKFPDDYIKTDIEHLALKEPYQKAVNLLLRYCREQEEASKIAIRIYRSSKDTQTGFLHSKCYIFRGATPDNAAWGIIGSSNFTAKGLNDNAELNYLEQDSKIILYKKETDSRLKGHEAWFYEKWHRSEQWNKTFLTEILKPSPIGKTVLKNTIPVISPHEVYIKYLQYCFAETLDTHAIQSLEEFLPSSLWKLDYQLTAVNQAYMIMKEHGGFILADVVGLGKTITAVLLIKRFLADRSFDGRKKNVLIVTPPAVKSSWQRTITTFGEKDSAALKQQIDFITTGKVGTAGDFEIPLREAELYDSENQQFRPSGTTAYGLIIVDESHNFRNETSNMYKALDALIAAIRPQPYIGLLSATPQNNSPRDLKNQIFLFQRDSQRTTLSGIPGGKLGTYFNEKEKEFTLLRKQKNNQAQLIALSADIREKVLRQLVIRRTRSDLKEWYKEDVKDLHFPVIKGPIAIQYEMTDETAELFSDTMKIIASYDEETETFVFTNETLHYYRYRAIEFLKDHKIKALYAKNTSAADVSKRLARLMQIQLVKRLESSLSAFKKSLENLKQYTYNMIQMIRDDRIFICPDIDVNSEIKKAPSYEAAYQVLTQKMKGKPESNRCFSRNDFDETYLRNLQHDLKILEDLYIRWSKVPYDPKMEAFKNALNNTYFEDYQDEKIYFFDKTKNNPSGHDEQKLVIFTEAIDTAKELTSVINSFNRHRKIKHRVLTITSENRERDKQKIMENFDANADEQKNDFNILITTDVLAEGINLHRSNTILNYDAPWNATRLMQRIGRVNRIGSKEQYVYVYNFMPTAQSDKLIQLVSIAHAKLQSFHSMFGEDNPVFTGDEDVYSFGEAPPDEKTLNALFEGEKNEQEHYIAELRSFKAAYPEEYKRIAELKPPLITGCTEHPSHYAVLMKGDHLSSERFLITETDGTAFLHTQMLALLEQLKTTSSAVLSSAEIQRLKKAAQNVYNRHTNRMMTRHDLSRNAQEALKVCAEFAAHKALSDEAKTLLELCSKKIRSGNMHYAKSILKLQRTLNTKHTTGNTEPSAQLFTADDINNSIVSRLSALSEADPPPSSPDIILAVGYTEND